jgi:hypothetical protein
MVKMVISFLEQDFAISVSIIWNQWKSRKMSDADCERYLVRCRDRTAPAAVLALEQIMKRGRMLDLAEEMTKVQKTLESRQCKFRSHSSIDAWLLQFGNSTYGFQPRFRCLVLIGGTQQGKTSKGMSLFGSTKTLKVSCGNCGPGVLPSLSRFDRQQHDAILFDEVRTDQVLNNREVFQANQYAQTLGQSACNPFAYSVWVYHVALILCTNSFEINATDLSEGDRDWLGGEKNLVIVQLAAEEKWFMES